METHQKSKGSIFAKNIMIVAACSTVTWFLCQHIKVTLTNSLSKRIFWAVNDDHQARSIKTGMYITFDQHVPRPVSRVVTFIKKAGCSSGEHLKVEAGSYYCNGKYLGHAKTKSLRGDPLTPFIYNGEIPAGMFFALGDHPDSYDSRYVGFISRDRIKEVAWALF